MAEANESGWRVPAAAALLKIAIHLPVIGRYGYHHDELYFLACGRHLSFGYVDHPPLIPWIARLMDELFGRWLFALRLPAVLAGAAAVFVTGMLVRRLGGGRLAQWIACLGMLVVPAYLRPAAMLTIVAFEPLIWVTSAYLLVRIADDEDRRLWVALGLVVGVGLLIKHSTLFLGVGIAASVLLTPMRRHLLSPWPWAGGMLALFLFLPNLLWQVEHGWPTVEFLRGLNARVAPHVNPVIFAAGQLIYMNPVTVPVWIAGLLWLFGENGRRYRALGWIWIAAFTLLATAGGKVYYLAAAYPPLFAAGAVAFERRRTRAESRATPRRRWLLPRPLNALLVGGLFVLPASLPILPIDATERYIGTLTFGLLEKAYEVTGDLHGQFGWRERV
ncbi:MAG: glycosyltransferase family 39 protein, partial [Candidatus Binatia bacterium]